MSFENFKDQHAYILPPPMHPPFPAPECPSHLFLDPCADLASATYPDPSTTEAQAGAVKPVHICELAYP